MSVGIKIANADTFRKKMSKLANDLDVRPSDILRNLIPEVITQLAYNSPIGDTNDPSYNYPNKPEQGFQAGWYVSNWQVTFGAPSDTPISNAGEAQGIGQSIDNAFAVMQQFTVKGTPNIYISNPVPYAQLIEEGHAKNIENVLAGVIQRLPTLIEDAILETALRK